MQPKKILIVMMLAFAMVLSACATPAQGQTNTGDTTPQTRTLSVTGNAQISLTPDIAYVSIGVHTENKDANQAVSSNNDQATKVVDALKTMGIDAKDIQTNNFNVYPQQNFGPNGEQLGTTFVVDNSVNVTVRDLSKLGDLLSAVVNAGANNINGVSFDIADKQSALAEARKQAVEDAQSQAQELAQAAGVTLGDVQSISYYNNVPMPIPQFEGKGGGGAAASVANVPVNPGQLVITASVSVVYALR
jgi:uncharacterized protein YggE